MASGGDRSSNAIASIGDICKIVLVDVLASYISRAISDSVLRISS